MRLEALFPRPREHRQPLSKRESLEEPAHGRQLKVRVRVDKPRHQYRGAKVDAPFGLVACRQSDGATDIRDSLAVNNNGTFSDWCGRNGQHPRGRVDRA